MKPKPRDLSNLLNWWDCKHDYDLCLDQFELQYHQQVFILDTLHSELEKSIWAYLVGNRDRWTRMSAACPPRVRDFSKNSCPCPRPCPCPPISGWKVKCKNQLELSMDAMGGIQYFTTTVKPNNGLAHKIYQIQWATRIGYPWSNENDKNCIKYDFLNLPIFHISHCLNKTLLHRMSPFSTFDLSDYLSFDIWFERFCDIQPYISEYYTAWILYNDFFAKICKCFNYWLFDILMALICWLIDYFSELKIICSYLPKLYTVKLYTLKLYQNYMKVTFITNFWIQVKRSMVICGNDSFRVDDSKSDNRIKLL